MTAITTISWLREGAGKELRAASIRSPRLARKAPVQRHDDPGYHRLYRRPSFQPMASNSGFPAGSLIATEKDFGYGRISIFPISPNLAAGTSYPVNGDDVTVTSVAFSANGTAYYGSGTESSNAGTFGTITFDGTQFLTHRLFGPPVGSDPRGGVIYTGTHRVSFDPFTGDIFTAGGNTIGQYDPSTNFSISCRSMGRPITSNCKRL